MSEFENLATAFQATQEALLKHSARAVDSALVVRNWLYGWYLVEFENAAAGRAELYGKELINRLSKRLKDKGRKGISPTNLRKIREFFQAYSEIQRAVSVTSSAGQDSPPFLQASDPSAKIQQTLSVESSPHLRPSLFAQIASSLRLGWSHYVEVLTLDAPAEAAGRTAHHRHPALPPQERRPCRTHPPAGRQHLRFEIPALPPLQRGIESPAGTNHPRSGRREIMKKQSPEPGGFKAISRWLSAATPPVASGNTDGLPESRSAAETAAGKCQHLAAKLNQHLQKRGATWK